MVWLHSKSPPQHIANVPESTVATADKLLVYMRQVNAQRLVNLKWGGVFEGNGGELSVHLFWEPDRALTYVQRNDAPIISTDDARCA